MAQWYFKPLQPGGKISEPIHGEFFSTDAISDPGTSLIREGIQNSLDQANGDDPVLVRIYLSGDDEAISNQNVEKYFRNVWDHYETPDNGLHKNELPDRSSECNFLVFEDFSTTGLEGNPEQAFKAKDGSKNNFYHFFRAEGQTDKHDVELGSWGVGKFVFYRSSRISTIFGLSIRASDKRKLLMGKTILKTHWVGDEYYQDGYYGNPPNSNNNLVMPSTDEEDITEFLKTFKLQRGFNEPGLSLVVPWPDQEIDEKTIVAAVIKDYFYPILVGNLEVIIETPNYKVCLESKNLIKELNKLDSQITYKLEPLIKLARWSQTIEQEEIITINKPDPNRAWKWSNELLIDENLDLLKKKYFNGEKIAIRIPVTVKKRNDENADSFFDVYLTRDNSEKLGRPIFIRDGIIVSKVDAPRTRGVRSLVIAHDKPITEFLRKAENPSHTEWQHVQLKEDYKFGYATDLDFIKRSVHELVRIISETEKEEDPMLLVDFFSLPKTIIEQEAVPSKEPKEEGNGDNPENFPPDPKLDTNPKSFRIVEKDGGFSILSTNNEPPDKLHIQAAYDRRKGNPLKKHTKSDFNLDKDESQFDYNYENIKIESRSDNEIIIKILNPHFKFHITGFDKKRQLYIKANKIKD